MVDDDIPRLVRRAEAVAERFSFGRAATPGPSSCTEATGRLLAMLAAGRVDGRLGEIGTGVGYGSAWMASAMPADATLVTIEIDGVRASAARRLFAADPRVRVRWGDARLLVERDAPYDLLFVDGAGYAADGEGFAGLLDLLRPGGQVVVDDVTPIAALCRPTRRSASRTPSARRSPGPRTWRGSRSWRRT